MAFESVTARRMLKVIQADPPAAPHADRPKTRGDCSAGPRPCPWVGCRHHLFLNVTPKGTIQFLEGSDVAALADMPDTCSLDVADRGPEEYANLGPRLHMTAFGARLSGAKAIVRLHQGGSLDECAPNDAVETEWDVGVNTGSLPKLIRRPRPDLGGFTHDRRPPS